MITSYNGIKRPNKIRIMLAIIKGTMSTGRRRNPSIHHPAMMKHVQRHPTSWGRE